ncbi:MAG: TolC family protein [Synergistaceae bacterium]|nr:TolC family protein [Synergistaceae bacterium]
MKRNLFLGAVLLWILTLLWPPGSFAAEEVGLDRYLEMVKEGNHTLQSGIRSVEAAYYGVLASVAPQRPSVTLSGSASYVTDQKTEEKHNRNTMVYNTALSLTQRIDISGTNTLDEQQQILSYERQRAEFDSNVNTLVAAAEENYWSAVLARENIALQKDVLRQRRENSRVTEEKYKQQLVPKLDLIRAEAQVVAAESLVTEAEALYRNRLATLTALTGANGGDVVPVEEPLFVPTFDVSVSLEKALLFRPDVRASRLALERSKILKKLAAKGMSPTLTGTIRWTPWAEPWNSSSPQDGELGGSLSLNIPLLDGNATKYGALNMDRLVQAAEASLRSAESAADVDLKVARNNWEKAAALEQDKKRQVERSDEELRITELMYNEGMGAQIDLINAQTENQRVRTDYLNAIQGMYIALVDLRKAVGDYSPDENGTWKEAVVKYGKGTATAKELKKQELRDQKDASNENKSAEKHNTPQKGLPKNKKQMKK